MEQAIRYCAYMFCGCGANRGILIDTESDQMCSIPTCQHHCEEVNRRLRYIHSLRKMVLGFDDESDRHNIIVEKVIKIYCLGVRDLFVVLNPRHLDQDFRDHLNELRRHAETCLSLLSLEKSKHAHGKDFLDKLASGSDD